MDEYAKELKKKERSYTLKIYPTNKIQAKQELRRKMRLKGKILELSNKIHNGELKE